MINELKACIELLAVSGKNTKAEVRRRLERLVILNTPLEELEKQLPF